MLLGLDDYGFRGQQRKCPIGLNEPFFLPFTYVNVMETQSETLTMFKYQRFSNVLISVTEQL